MCLAAGVRFSSPEPVNAKAMKYICNYNSPRKTFSRKLGYVKQAKMLTLIDQSFCLL